MKSTRERGLVVQRNVWCPPPAAVLIKVWHTRRLGTLLVAGVLGACGVLFATGIIGDEEAPIRVRNGSLDFVLEDQSQEWTKVSQSRSWRVSDKRRPTDLFDITVHPRTGATCTGSLSTRQPYIELTYDAAGEKVVVLDTPGHFTRVNPPSGVTLESSPKTKYLLTYAGSGYLKRIAAGPNRGHLSVICSFADKTQLDYIEIRNP